MAYFTLTDLNALIPAGWVTEALDDDRNGVQDQFSTVQALAEGQVNALIGMRYTVPVDTSAASAPVDFLRHASSLIAAALCYARRNKEALFPYKDDLQLVREQLHQIAKGELPLFPGQDRTLPSAVIIAEDSRVYSEGIGF
jgi:phage gp36-like protein